jgi:hypothetical protein
MNLIRGGRYGGTESGQKIIKSGLKILTKITEYKKDIN